VGGTALDTYGRSPDIKPLDLSRQELGDLVAFLESLTSPVAGLLEQERLEVP
jgi:hypothetical protein